MPVFKLEKAKNVDYNKLFEKTILKLNNKRISHSVVLRLHMHFIYESTHLNNIKDDYIYMIYMIINISIVDIVSIAF